MATIICTRPNASELINGVAFKRQEDGSVIAHDVSDDVALAFAEIPGYMIVGEAVEAPKPVAEKQIDDQIADATEKPKRGRPSRA